MKPNPRAVILLGAPGSGKGTQARVLSARFAIPHISTGAMLRAAIHPQDQSAEPAENTEGESAETSAMVRMVMNRVMKERVGSKIASGVLVSDQLVNGIVEKRIQTHDCSEGFILDGFPRTLNQAKFLDQLLARIGRWSPLVLNIAVDREVLIKRAIGRRTCPVDGEIYNIYFKPPRRDEVCDLDGAALIHRSDDNEETVRQRQAVYEEQTRPLIEYYRQRDCFHEVNGDLLPELIGEELGRFLGAPESERHP
jgi:adenylate kinase